MMVSCAVDRKRCVHINKKQRDTEHAPEGSPTFRLIRALLLQFVVQLFHVATLLHFELFEASFQSIPIFRPACELRLDLESTVKAVGSATVRDGTR